MTQFRRLVLAALIAIASATPMAAQVWARPAKTPNTDVICTGCPGAAANKKTPGYPATVGKYVGRYLDSQSVNDYQQPFRTARARNVLAVPSLNRLYFIIGSSVMAYDMDRFFQRLDSSEALVSAKTVPVSGWGGAGRGDVLLKWDEWFYAENSGSGWIVPGNDGQERLFSYDVDDQGYVYMAYTFFNWGIAKDGRGTNGALMTSLQVVNDSDIFPRIIAALKGSNGAYYAVIGDLGTPLLNVYDVTNRLSPVRQGNISKTMSAYAKNADATKVGIITLPGKFEIYDTDRFVTGGQAMLSEMGPGNLPVKGVASDGTNFYIVCDGANGLVISTYAPNGSGGYRKVADFQTSRVTLFTGRLTYGDGYLVQAGATEGGYELRLFKATVNSVSEVNLEIPSVSGKAYYFKNYYIINSSGRPDYVAPSVFDLFFDSMVVKRPGHTYLIVTAYGLGDVYELQGSDSLAITSAGSVGPPNPNRPAGSGAGPFYGDLVGFTAATTAAAQSNITWNFGNDESGNANTDSGVTGVQKAHQYSGITSAASLPLTRVVKAFTDDPNVSGTTTVTIAKPAVSIGVKNFQSLALVPNASSSAPIVAGDNWVDTSDGSDVSHFTTWTIDTTSTNAKPSESVGVGTCSAQRTLTVTAHYGTYVGSSPNEQSVSDLPMSIGGIKYSVRPFAASINMASTATDITFSSSSRASADATVLSAAQLAALQYKWDLLDANGQVIQSGPSGSGVGMNIPAFTVAKSVFTSRGIKARLLITSSTPVTGGCAGLGMESSTALTQDLNGPDPVLNGDCTAGGPPCSFNVGSSSGVNQSADGWTYSWSVSPSSDVIIGNTSSQTFQPTFKNVGSYTISVIVANALGSKTVAKTISVTVPGSSCSTISPGNNVFITYYSGNNSCSYADPNASCSANVPISFKVNASSFGSTYDFGCATHTFSWSFGDGNTGSGQNVTHSYNGSGTYSPTVTVSNGVQTVPISVTLKVGNVVQPPPVNPPPVNPPPVTPPPGGCGTMTAGGNVFIAYGTQSGSCSYTTTTACSLGETITFNASAFLYNFGCANHSFQWNFGDGSAGAFTQTATHAYNLSNTYTVSLTVSNGSQTITTTVPVKIGTGSNPPPTNPPPNPPPVDPGSCGTITPGTSVFVVYSGPTSGCSHLSGDCGQNEEISFAAAAFGYSFACATHTFQWDFQDGSDPVSGQSVKHKFASAGEYHIKLLVSVNGTTTPIPQTVKVSGTIPGGPPPVAGFPFDFKFDPRQVNGTLIPHEYVFTAFPTDAAATTTKYSWDFGDGQTSTSTTPVVNHTYSDGKDYTITLTVQGYTGNAKHTLSPPRRRSAGR